MLYNVLDHEIRDPLRQSTIADTSNHARPHGSTTNVLVWRDGDGNEEYYGYDDEDDLGDNNDDGYGR